MTTLMRASNQWASRPDDERFLSLDAMAQKFSYQREHSHQSVVPSKQITVVPTDEGGIGVTPRGGDSILFEPTHWSFSQLAQIAGVVPAESLRRMARVPQLVADNLNYGLKVYRDVEDVGVLTYRDGTDDLRAVTGPNYGRVWNSDVIAALRQRFGDGVTGDWKVPGEFGKDVEVTKANTTLYASDRDMFVFLADEKNRVELPGRREGKTGSLARGFFVWNSEVGKTSLGLGFFLFDFVCCNRIVWGAEDYQELRIRHTVSAPSKWVDEMHPLLLSYSNAAVSPLEAKLKAAQQKKIDDVESFLSTRFGSRLGQLLQQTSMTEEDHPIETLWDAATAVTAYARGLPHVDARVEIERKAGEILSLAA